MSKLLALLSITFLAAANLVQAQHTLQPVIAGPADIHNTPVGSNISIRCQLVDENGREIFRVTNNNTPVASLLENEAL